VETTHNPIRQTLDISLSLCIDFRAPRWEAGPVLIEAVDGFLTEVSNEVYGFLEGHPMVAHHGRDHVVCVAFGLFTIIREEILEIVENENQRKLNKLVQILTFDHVTTSFAVSSKLWMI